MLIQWNSSSHTFFLVNFWPAHFSTKLTVNGWESKTFWRLLITMCIIIKVSTFAWDWCWWVWHNDRLQWIFGFGWATGEWGEEYRQYGLPVGFQSHDWSPRSLEADWPSLQRLFIKYSCPLHGWWKNIWALAFEKHMIPCIWWSRAMIPYWLPSMLRNKVSMKPQDGSRNFRSLRYGYVTEFGFQSHVIGQKAWYWMQRTVQLCRKMQSERRWTNGTFCNIGRGATAPTGCKKITISLVFEDVKHDLRHMAYFAAGGHLTDQPKDSVYLGADSMQSLHLVALLAELNGLQLWAAVGNAYLEALTQGKAYFCRSRVWGAGRSYPSECCFC